MSEHEIRDVSDVSITQDGETIKLTITTNNGASLPLSFQHKAFAKFLENLIGVGASASRQRTGGASVTFSEATPNIFAPTPLTNMALAESADRSQMFLVLRLFDMDLSFQVSKPTLRQLAGAFVQMTQALDADESKPH